MRNSPVADQKRLFDTEEPTRTRRSFVSRLLTLNPFHHSSSTISPPHSVPTSPRAESVRSQSPRDLPSFTSSKRSTTSVTSIKDRPQRASSVLSSLGQRLKRRQQTWSGDLDPQAAQRLREFYARNNEANVRDAKELERRASIWERIQQAREQHPQNSFGSDSSPSPSPSSDSREAPPYKRKSVGHMNLADLEAFINDTEPSEPQPSPPGCPRQRMLYRRPSSIKPAAGKSLEAAVVLQGFVKSGQSSAEDLIKPYDIFSPDMRSTRWTEFCRILQEDRADFDQYMNGVGSVRGAHRAATVGGIRPGRPSPY